MSKFSRSQCTPSGSAIQAVRIFERALVFTSAILVYVLISAAWGLGKFINQLILTACGAAFENARHRQEHLEDLPVKLCSVVFSGVLCYLLGICQNSDREELRFKKKASQWSFQKQFEESEVFCHVFDTI